PPLVAGVGDPGSRTDGPRTGAGGPGSNWRADVLAAGHNWRADVLAAEWHSSHPVTSCSISRTRVTFGRERPPWNSDSTKAFTSIFADSEPVTCAPRAMIWALLLFARRSAA